MSICFAQKKNHQIQVLRIPWESEFQPYFLKDPDFYQGPLPLEELKTYPNVPLAPYDNGLVIIDFDTKWVGIFDGFSFYNRLQFIGHRLLTAKRNAWMEEQSKLCILFEKALLANAITHLTWQITELSGERVTITKTLEEEKIFSLEEAWHWMERHPKTHATLRFIFTPPTWTVEGFEENALGVQTLVATLIQKGFDLMENLEAWDRYTRSFNSMPFKTPISNLIQTLTQTHWRQIMPEASNSTIQSRL